MLISLSAAAVSVVLALVPGAAVAQPEQAPTKPAAGGLAIPHRAEGRVVKAAGAPRAEFHAVGVDAIEPTLGITKRGDVFYTATGGLSPVVMKSTDKGRTWEEASPNLAGQNTHFLTLDPYIYVDESTGRIFDIDLTVACAYLSISDDSGESWITNPVACGRPINDHQTLFSGPPALTPMTVFPEVVYYCWNDFGLGTSCSKSLDGGLTWIPETQAFFGIQSGDDGEGDVCGGFIGHGIVAEDGTVYIPKEHCGRPWIAISKDEGLTWQQIQVATNPTEPGGSDTTVALDSKGNLIYGYESKEKFYLSVSEDGGETWSKSINATAPGVTEINLPTLDAGKDGSVALSYMGSENSPYPRCKPDCREGDWADEYQKVTWNGYITMTTDVLSRDPLFFSGSVNDRRDPIYRGHCDFFTGRCSPVLDFLDIEIGPDGTPYATYVDACTTICATGGPRDASAAMVGRLAGGPPLR